MYRDAYRWVQVPQKSVSVPPPFPFNSLVKMAVVYPCSVSFLERVEDHSAGFTERIQAAVDAHSVQLLAASAVDLQDLEARSDVPDVHEGDVCELAAPFHGDADAAEESADHVAQAFAAVETLVGVGPHTVHGVDPLRLRKHIFESDLSITTGLWTMKQWL